MTAEVDGRGIGEVPKGEVVEKCNTQRDNNGVMMVNGNNAGSKDDADSSYVFVSGCDAVSDGRLEPSDLNGDGEHFQSVGAGGVGELKVVENGGGLQGAECGIKDVELDVVEPEPQRLEVEEQIKVEVDKSSKDAREINTSQPVGLGAAVSELCESSKRVDDGKPEDNNSDSAAKSESREIDDEEKVEEEERIPDSSTDGKDNHESQDIVKVDIQNDQDDLGDEREARETETKEVPVEGDAQRGLERDFEQNNRATTSGPVNDPELEREASCCGPVSDENGDGLPAYHAVGSPLQILDGHQKSVEQNAPSENSESLPSPFVPVESDSGGHEMDSEQTSKAASFQVADTQFETEVVAEENGDRLPSDHAPDRISENFVENDRVDAGENTSAENGSFQHMQCLPSPVACGVAPAESGISFPHAAGNHAEEKECTGNDDSPIMEKLLTSVATDERLKAEVGLDAKRGSSTDSSPADDAQLEIQAENGLGEKIEGENGLGEKIENENGLDEKIEGENGLGEKIEGENGLVENIEVENGLGENIDGENDPRENVECEIVPDENIEGKNGPDETIGDDDAPVHNTRGENGPDEAIKVEDGPSVTVECENGPNESIGRENGPDETMVGKNDPDETVKSENCPDESIQGENGPKETIEVENSPVKSIQGENGPEETIEAEKGSKETIKAENGVEETIEVENGPEEIIECEVENGPEETIQAESGLEETLEAEGPKETIEVENGPQETIQFEGENILGETIEVENGPQETIQCEGENILGETIEVENGPEETTEREVENSPGKSIQGENGPEETIEAENGSEGTIKAGNGTEKTVEVENDLEETIECEVENGLEETIEAEVENGLEETIEAENGLEETIKAESGLDETIGAENGPKETTEVGNGAVENIEVENGPQETIQCKGENLLEETIEVENGPAETTECEAENSLGKSIQGENGPQETTEDKNGLDKVIEGENSPDEIVKPENGADKFILSCQPDDAKPETETASVASDFEPKESAFSSDAVKIESVISSEIIDCANGQSHATSGTNVEPHVNGLAENSSSTSLGANLKSESNVENMPAQSSRDIPCDDDTGSESKVRDVPANSPESALNRAPDALVEVEDEAHRLTAIDSGSKPTIQGVEDIAGVHGDQTSITSPEDATADALEGPNTEVVKRPFYYLIRMPRYDDENLREQIKHAQLKVDEKTQSRDAIRSEIQIKRATWKECGDNFEAAMSEEKVARDRLRSKRQEMDSAQSEINRLKNAISVEDIDGKIRNMEHTIQHETLPLREEKHLIREIKNLKQLREQLSSNMGRQDDVQQALDQKEQIEDRMKLLRKDQEILRDNVLKAEAVTKAARKKYNEEGERLNELQAQFKAADDIRQEAYAHLQSLRKQLYEKSKHFWNYKNDIKLASDFASNAKREELQQLCVNQVEKVMELWNNNDEFRKEYIKCNTRSTLRRLRTLDGRSLGPDEEPPIIPIANGKAIKDNPVSPQPAPEQEKKSVQVDTEKVKEKSIAEVVEQKNQTTKSKKPVKPAPLANGLATVSGRDEIEEAREEERKLTKEEEEAARKAEELRRQEEAAKLREQRLLEEKVKAKEALERKKRNAEKAQARALLRAQREAEQKEKEREKKARKKERKKAAVVDSTDAANEEECIPRSETPTETLKEPENGEKNLTVTKRSQRPLQFTKQTKAKAIPPPLRNRSKRRMQPWMWVLLTALVVFALFLVGNSNFSFDFGLLRRSGF